MKKLFYHYLYHTRYHLRLALPLCHLCSPLWTLSDSSLLVSPLCEEGGGIEATTVFVEVVVGLAMLAPSFEEPSLLVSPSSFARGLQEKDDDKKYSNTDYNL